ncbi:MAG: hypothetical protein ACQES0_09320 [Bacteroidota bacterium]
MNTIKKPAVVVAIIGIAMLMFVSVTAELQAQESVNDKADGEIPVEFVNTGNPDYDDLVYKQKLIAYLRGVEGMPEYQATGNRSDDRETFMKEMKIWYEAHPEYLDVLDLRTFEAFQKYDASCYPNPPEYTKGCSPKEEEAYRKSFRIWMAHHPEAPKLQGDDQASKDEFEREKAKFYELYFKK